MPQTRREEKRGVIPLYIKAELVPDKCNVVELCEACERVTGHGSIDGATLVNRLWRVLPFNEVSRAKLLVDGVRIQGKLLKFEGKNPFLHPSGQGECQSTRLIIKNLPFSYSQEAVERNLISSGFKLRGKLTWMKGRNRSTGHLSDFRDGRRAVFIDLPTGQVNQIIQMGPFKARIEYPEMKTTCFRCLKEGHTARNCTGEEVCHTCKKTGHRKDQCPGLDLVSDHDSDSEGEENNINELPSNTLRDTHGSPSMMPPFNKSSVTKTYSAVLSHGKSEDSLVEENVISKLREAAFPETNNSSSVVVSQTLVTIEAEKDYLSQEATGHIVIPGTYPAKSTIDSVSSEGPSKGSVSGVASDSPMTEYIKSVDFVELPCSSRQSQASDLNVIPSLTQQCVVETPTSRGVPVNDSSVLSSVWDTQSDVHESEDELLILATKMSENKVSPLASDKEMQMKGKKISKQALPLDDIVSTPGAKADQVSRASQPSSSDVHAQAKTGVTGEYAEESSEKFKEDETETQVFDEKDARPPSSSSFTKFKRVFSAIVSPSSEHKKEKSEGPVSKKKN